MVGSEIVDTVEYGLIVKELLEIVDRQTRAYPCMHLMH